ncbi:hypothetical protein K438DRAFT_1763712 [Mycena galopus ATCC 62051]|nr:hypothetical protein K438DRAFT_1763712 [Mycena galopus ATCC 62051]
MLHTAFVDEPPSKVYAIFGEKCFYKAHTPKACILSRSLTQGRAVLESRTEKVEWRDRHGGGFREESWKWYLLSGRAGLEGWRILNAKVKTVVAAIASKNQFDQIMNCRILALRRDREEGTSLYMYVCWWEAGAWVHEGVRTLWGAGGDPSRVWITGLGWVVIGETDSGSNRLEMVESIWRLAVFCLYSLLVLKRSMLGELVVYRTQSELRRIGLGLVQDIYSRGTHGRVRWIPPVLGAWRFGGTYYLSDEGGSVPGLGDDSERSRDSCAGETEWRQVVIAGVTAETQTGSDSEPRDSRGKEMNCRQHNHCRQRVIGETASSGSNGVRVRLPGPNVSSCGILFLQPRNLWGKTCKQEGWNGMDIFTYVSECMGTAACGEIASISSQYAAAVGRGSIPGPNVASLGFLFFNHGPRNLRSKKCNLQEGWNGYTYFCIRAREWDVVYGARLLAVKRLQSRRNVQQVELKQVHDARCRNRRKRNAAGSAWIWILGRHTQPRHRWQRQINARYDVIHGHGRRRTYVGVATCWTVSKSKSDSGACWNRIEDGESGGERRRRIQRVELEVVFIMYGWKMGWHQGLEEK